MANEQYIEMIEKYPNLTIEGFGIEVQQGTKLTHQELWDQKRQELKDAHQEFEYCCQWIGDFYDLVPRNGAYHLKHQVEKWLQQKQLKPDYIAEGVFILAAVHSGYRIRRVKHSTGARIGNWVGVPLNLKIPKRPGKLTVIREAGWQCPGLVQMR